MPTTRKKTIMYLAPELPALSATFVYNELNELKAQGHEVYASSVHEPSSFAENSKLSTNDVFYLYNLATSQKLSKFVTMSLTHPLKVASTLLMLLSDIISLGVLNRTALGQIYRFYNAVSLADKIIKSDVEHLHIHFAHVPTDIGMYAAKMASIPFSVQAHANDIFERCWLLKEKIERSKFFATISKYNITHLQQFSRNNEKLKLIHCGVVKRNFQQRKSLPKNDKFVIGFLGRLVEKKGTIYLLQAAKELQDLNSNVVIEIIGNGPELEDLKQYLKKYRVENVSFLGQKPNHEISNWLTRLNCFVLPCVKDKNGDMDGIPVSLMEAMLIGVPVISTKVSGVPELVIANETGLIVETKNSEALSNAILQIIEMSDKELLKIVEQAKTHILTHFELEKETSKLSTLINEDNYENN